MCASTTTWANSCFGDYKQATTVCISKCQIPWAVSTFALTSLAAWPAIRFALAKALNYAKHRYWCRIRVVPSWFNFATLGTAKMYVTCVMPIFLENCWNLLCGRLNYECTLGALYAFMYAPCLAFDRVIVSQLWLSYCYGHKVVAISPLRQK